MIKNTNFFEYHHENMIKNDLIIIKGKVLSWDKSDIEKNYGVNSWSERYFDISQDGKLEVCPNRDELKIPLADIIEEAKSQNVQFPIVLRFHDIIRNQLNEINQAFKRVISEASYNGKYFGVYPIKVNQMREVVEEVIHAGREHDFGLEAGSKPELLAVLAYNDNPNSLTVLNGYKDEEYMRLAMIGRKIGRKVIVIIEKYSELPLLVKVANEMNVKPLIGIRVKLNVDYSGKWAGSAGEKSKFGLSASEVIKCVNFLTEHGLIDCFNLLHFHIGSQVSDIQTFKDAITEAGYYYTKLCLNHGCKLEYIDVGGGLGVDYDGSKRASDSSRNYNIENYVSDIVWGLKQICDLDGVKHPHIVTESGRATVAYHSCVITNVVDTIKTNQNYNTDKKENEHIIVSNMRELFEEEALSEKSYQNIYNEALNIKKESHQAFKLGVLNLDEKAVVETLYQKLIYKISKIVKDLEFVPDGLMSLSNQISVQYLCNFSIFQSIVDHWAIDQLLPIVPLTRLNEEPKNKATIVDITCDSDGKIDKFISRDGVESTLLLHDLKKNEEYLLGIFLTGAYQDVMGDMHNLFGRVSEVHVYGDKSDPSGFYIEEVILGSNSSKVLKTMQYHPEEMAQKIKRLINAQIESSSIAPREGVKLADFYENSLSSYTYLRI